MEKMSNEIIELADEVLNNNHLQASPTVWYALHQIKKVASKLIYCKDCVRHNVSVGDWYDNHELKVCPLVGHRGSAIGHEFDYQFCAYAERRTDETD